MSELIQTYQFLLQEALIERESLEEKRDAILAKTGRAPQDMEEDDSQEEEKVTDPTKTAAKQPKKVLVDDNGNDDDDGDDGDVA